MCLKSESKYWAAIALVAVCGTAQFAAAASGDLDPTFGSGGKLKVQVASQQRDFVRAVAVQPDGKIVVGAELGDFGATANTSVLMRLNPNGSLDPVFGSGGKVVNSGQLHLPSLVLQPDG